MSEDFYKQSLIRAKELLRDSGVSVWSCPECGARLLYITFQPIVLKSYGRVAWDADPIHGGREIVHIGCECGWKTEF